MAIRKLLFFIIVFSIILSGCQNESTDSQVTPTAEKITPTSTVLSNDKGSPITSSSNPSGGNGRTPICFVEKLPPGYENSAAVQGMRLFTNNGSIKLRILYFPPNCKTEDVEKDVNLLFYGSYLGDEELALVLMEPTYEGTLGRLYAHLSRFNFWAMGPEDYPMLLDRRANIETKIILFRVDRMNGEGTEGNGLLELTSRMGEHEYIHTIQGVNNPDLAEMIWSDSVYRYFIENYANVRNNFGHMYYEASYTILMLLQFLDSLNAKGSLEEKTVEILKNKGMDMDTFLNRHLLIYNQHIRAHVEQVAGKPYLDRLSNGRVSPLTLVEMAGSGDIEAYEVIRQLYDENIGEYDEKFYGPNRKQYMPSFDELFDLN